MNEPRLYELDCDPLFGTSDNGRHFQLFPPHPHAQPAVIEEEPDEEEYEMRPMRVRKSAVLTTDGDGNTIISWE